MDSEPAQPDSTRTPTSLVSAVKRWISLQQLVLASGDEALSEDDRRFLSRGRLGLFLAGFLLIDLLLGILFLSIFRDALR